MKRVRLDFNSIREDGTFRITNSASDQPLDVLDSVILFDPFEEDLSYLGRVTGNESPDVFSAEIFWDVRLPSASPVEGMDSVNLGINLPSLYTSSSSSLPSYSYSVDRIRSYSSETRQGVSA